MVEVDPHLVRPHLIGVAVVEAVVIWVLALAAMAIKVFADFIMLALKGEAVVNQYIQPEVILIMILVLRETTQLNIYHYECSSYISNN